MTDRRLFTSSNTITVKCLYCGTSLIIGEGAYKSAMKKNAGKRWFCSQLCFAEFRKENN